MRIADVVIATRSSMVVEALKFTDNVLVLPEEELANFFGVKALEFR